MHGGYTLILCLNTASSIEKGRTVIIVEQNGTEPTLIDQWNTITHVTRQLLLQRPSSTLLEQYPQAVPEPHYHVKGLVTSTCRLLLEDGDRVKNRTKGDWMDHEP